MAIFSYENILVLITTLLNLVPKVPVDDHLAFVQVMALHQTGNKQLPESVITQFTYISVTWPQWVSYCIACDIVIPPAQRSCWGWGGGGGGGYIGFTPSVHLPVGTLHSLQWFWVRRRIFIYSHHNTFVFSLRRPFVHGLFVSWSATGWRFVINSRANIYVTIDCSTVLPLVLGVVTRQKPHINGSVKLGADESPWPWGTPSWHTPLSWMILSKQKNLHLFSSQYICVFSKTSVHPAMSAL